MLLSACEHTAFGAGVAVTMLRASKVGVKVGMVGRGVIVGGAGASVGWGVPLGVEVVSGVRVSGVREVGVSTTLDIAAGVGVAVGAGWTPQAGSRRQKRVKASSSLRIFIPR